MESWYFTFKFGSLHIHIKSADNVNWITINQVITPSVLLMQYKQINLYFQIDIESIKDHFSWNLQAIFNLDSFI